MLRKHYFGILVIISSAARLHKALKTCKEQARSTYGHYLAGHVISTRISSSLSECVIMCLHDFRCKSMNFIMNDKSCDLNDADRHTHPEDYGPKEGSVYMDTTEKHEKGGFKSCAEIHKELPQAESGYYWVKIGNREAQVYCDMENYGGGWTLVVSISSKNIDHLQRKTNNCLNSTLCVPLTDNNIAGRKLSDEDIHRLAHTEGTFRVDCDPLNTQVTVFYQIPSGPENFDSSCSFGVCPRIIVSYSYPYHWETNPCTTTDVGYRIVDKCHRVFDGHDDGECGSTWKSSGHPGRRALYGHPCPANPSVNSLGIFKNRDGMLYVK